MIPNFSATDDQSFGDLEILLKDTINQQKILKKRDAHEKKLEGLELRGGKLSNSEILNLMGDNKLVERYTEYICNSMFKHADPYIKNKYNNYKEKHQIVKKVGFFDRMEMDLKKRKDRFKSYEK